ncbi:MAG TPA: DinB family protein [Candidatus Sulfotelmatobacter sp.]|nr:DinB family protein [Candidatus Sulfotelmatobacter sp.]
MDSSIEELYAHQEWADAEHWRAIEAHPPAFSDVKMRERLLHIHQVQHAFLWVTGSRSAGFAFKKMEDFPSMLELKNYGREGLAQLNAFVHSLSSDAGENVIEVPWFRPAAKISVRQALTQTAMHSHYHRGQNATRLRELGGTPPTTDFIVWLYKGKPAANW